MGCSKIIQKIGMKMNDSNKKIIIATGGTGGHIFPAVSLTKFLHTEKKNSANR